MTIHRYYPGYQEAQMKVRKQTLDEDLDTIDSLFGRENLEYGDSPETVKAEALRQLEIEFRSEVNEEATFWVEVAKAQKSY